MMKTKDDFLREAIEAKIAGDAACGCGDPYPHDVEARAKLEAYIALGGTYEEANLALKERLANAR